MVLCRFSSAVVIVFSIVFLSFVNEDGRAQELPENRGWLGIMVEPQKLNDQEVSLLVHSVLEDGPAGEAGVQPNDLITHINGEVIDFPTNVDFLNFFAGIRPGDKLELTTNRSGEDLLINVVACVMPREMSQILDVFLKEAIEHPMSLLPESE